MLDRLEAERKQSIRSSLAAQESERLRVARELHDEIGQSLTAVLLHFEHLIRIAPQELTEDLAEARETARASLDEVREIARGLRPEVLDDLGLQSALGALTDRLAEQTDCSIRRQIGGRLPELDPEAELVIYRVAQEGLTNALRHSEASTIAVSLTAADGRVILDVSDDGRGLDDGPPGAGIQGMRERALLIGAELQIESAAGEGTRIKLQVPAGERGR
jgi:two-component system, NarL family, sensor histidine kinase UhpB